MISVPIDRIVPLTDARDNFSRLIHDIETLSDGLYVLTKGGKPAIALINIKYLEEIMGNKESPATGNEQLATSHGTKIAPPTKPVVSTNSPTNSSQKPELPQSKPEASSQMPGASLSFEVPRIPPIPKPVANPPAGGQLPDASYDVKPTVNPTWTGEEPKMQQSTSRPSTSFGINQPSAPSSLASSQNQNSPLSVPKPEASSQMPGASLPVPSSPSTVLPSTPLGVNGVNQSPVPSPQTPNPPTPTKPPVNPWPIIPPRAPSEQGIRDNLSTVPPRQAPPVEKGYESSTTVPPRAPSEQGIRDNSATVPPQPVNTALPLASSSLAPSQNPSSLAPPLKPVASSQPPVASLPEASFPKMVAPPPPPPPSSLPRIPSSFQTVPVPINGNKEPGLQSAISSQQSAVTGSPAESREPKADSLLSSPPLPPPPITTAPAPFASSPDGKPLASSSLAPSQNQNSPLSVPKPATSSQLPGASDSIAFDQPPTTIPEPGEDLPKESLASSASSAIATSQNSSAPAPKPEASSQLPGASPPPSVQDIEI